MDIFIIFHVVFLTFCTVELVFTIFGTIPTKVRCGTLNKSGDLPTDSAEIAKSSADITLSRVCRPVVLHFDEHIE